MKPSSLFPANSSSSKSTLPELIVIGGSAGSFKVVKSILSGIQNIHECPPIVLCLHRLRSVRNGFSEALSLSSVTPVREPFDKDRIFKGNIYLAPANYHLSIELGKTFALSSEQPIHNSRPAIDLLFETASYVFRKKVLGIVLSGANRDGANGLKRIKEGGGITIVQHPEEAEIKTMPLSAMKKTNVDAVLKTHEILEAINELTQNSGASQRLLG